MIHRTAVTLTTVGLLLAACAPKGARSYNEGQKALAKKEYAQAVEAFEKATRENPDFGEAYYNLGAARYHLAVQQLGALVQRRGSATLRKRLAALRAPASGPAVSTDPGGADPKARAEIARALAALPMERTAPILSLLRRSFADKARALALFKAGKWVVVTAHKQRKKMRSQLEAVERLHKHLYETVGGDRGQLLLAIARPSLLAVGPSAPRGGATP